MKHVEATINGADGLKLFTQRHEIDSPKAAVVIVHGYCEHSMRYGHVIERLEESGYSSYTLDQRGHGRSEGPRASVLKFEEYLDDLEIYLKEVRSHYGDGPLFLLGHSMGGLIVTQYALARKPDIAGVVLSSPFLGLKVAVPAWKSTLGKLISKIAPSVSLKSDLDPHLLSHDETLVQDYIADPNVSKIANARWFTESAAAQEYCMENANNWSYPALFMHGGDDRIADPDTTRKVFSRLPDNMAELIIHEGLFHEIFNETDRQKVMDDMINWIDKQLEK